MPIPCRTAPALSGNATVLEPGIELGLPPCARGTPVSNGPAIHKGSAAAGLPLCVGTSQRDRNHPERLLGLRTSPAVTDHPDGGRVADDALEFEPIRQVYVDTSSAIAFPVENEQRRSAARTPSMSVGTFCVRTWAPSYS